MSDQDDEYYERQSEVKKELTEALKSVGVNAWPWELEDDILVEGPLSVIMEFCQDYRSEIEELG